MMRFLFTVGTIVLLIWLGLRALLRWFFVQTLSRKQNSHREYTSARKSEGEVTIIKDDQQQTRKRTNASPKGEYVPFEEV